MAKHVQIVAWLYIALSSLWALAAIAAFFIFSVVSLGGWAIGHVPDLHSAPWFLKGFSPALLLMGAGNIIAGALLLISVPGILGGVGLLMRRPWARTLVIALGILNIIVFYNPLGIALGIYTLWVMFKNETVRLFQPGPPT